MKKFFLKGQGGSRWGRSDRFKDFQRFQRVTSELVSVVEQLKVMDSFGCADRWLCLILEAVGNFVKGFGAFYDEVDVFVKENIDVSSVVKRENFDGVELLDDPVFSMLVELVKLRAVTVVGASVESSAVMSDVVEAFKKSVFDCGGIQGGVEDEPCAVVNQGDHDSNLVSGGDGGVRGSGQTILGKK